MATLRTQGPAAALRYGAGVVRAVVRPPPVPRKTNPIDEEFGTDTAESSKLHDLDISSPNYRYGVYYRATRFGTLQEVLVRLPVEPSRCTRRLRVGKGPRRAEGGHLSVQEGHGR
jgi:hypothetical protein